MHCPYPVRGPKLGQAEDKMSQAVSLEHPLPWEWQICKQTWQSRGKEARPSLGNYRDIQKEGALAGPRRMHSGHQVGQVGQDTGGKRNSSWKTGRGTGTPCLGSMEEFCTSRELVCVLWRRKGSGREETQLEIQGAVSITSPARPGSGPFLWEPWRAQGL